MASSVPTGNSSKPGSTNLPRPDSTARRCVFVVGRRGRCPAAAPAVSCCGRRAGKRVGRPRRRVVAEARRSWEPNTSAAHAAGDRNPPARADPAPQVGGRDRRGADSAEDCWALNRSEGRWALIRSAGRWALNREAERCCPGPARHGRGHQHPNRARDRWHRRARRCSRVEAALRRHRRPESVLDRPDSALNRLGRQDLGLATSPRGRRGCWVPRSANRRRGRSNRQAIRRSRRSRRRPHWNRRSTTSRRRWRCCHHHRRRPCHRLRRRWRCCHRHRHRRRWSCCRLRRRRSCCRRPRRPRQYRMTSRIPNRREPTTGVSPGHAGARPEESQAETACGREACELLGSRITIPCRGGASRLATRLHVRDVKRAVCDASGKTLPCSYRRATI